jgi:hypothetical protein
MMFSFDVGSEPFLIAFDAQSQKVTGAELEPAA